MGQGTVLSGFLSPHVAGSAKPKLHKSIERKSFPLIAVRI